MTLAIAGLALDVVLADQRLLCDLAERVVAQAAEARVGDLDADLGARVLGQVAVEVGGDPLAHPGQLARGGDHARPDPLRDLGQRVSSAVRTLRQRLVAA